MKNIANKIGKESLIHRNVECRIERIISESNFILWFRNYWTDYEVLVSLLFSKTFGFSFHQIKGCSMSKKIGQAAKNVNPKHIK